MEHFVCTFGIPGSILANGGTNFLSNILKQTCTLLDIEKRKISPCHPRTNGFLERSHKTLKAYLRSFVDNDGEWDDLLHYTMFYYNTTIHTSTAFTPYELVFGRRPNMPASLPRTSQFSA